MIVIIILAAILVILSIYLSNKFKSELIIVLMLVSAICGMVVMSKVTVSHQDYLDGNYKKVLKITTDDKGNIIDTDTIYTKELNWW